MVLSMEKWKGQVAIISGAAAGIGAAISTKLLEAGVKVVGLEKREDVLEQFSKAVQSKPGQFFPVHCDVSLESDILAAFKWTIENVGPISILVNNAGVYKQYMLTEISTDELNQLFDTNVIGLSIATREAVRNMKENNIDGHIIHISSVASHSIKYAGIGAYGASKFCVRALTEGLRLDLNAQKSKIKISSVSPGGVDTELLATLLKDRVHTIPKLKPEDIADAIIYILSTPPGVQVHDLIIKPTGENW